MPSRFAPKNRPAAVHKRKNYKGSMTISPSSSNGDFLNLDEDGWKQSRVLRCSYRVLQLIGKATLTEKVIREALGNNPDTSKALRLLVKRKMIKRVGYGGRSCPFHYQSLANSESEDKRDTSSAEDSEVIQELRPAVKAKRSSLISMKREPCDANGIEPHQVLVTHRIPHDEHKPFKGKVPKSHKKGSGSGSVGKGIALGKGKAPPAAACMEPPEEEPSTEYIPVPGWRLVDDYD